MEIGIWGDSITYGEGDAEALGWVGRIRKSLLNNGEVGVYNRGICGDTSEDILKRFTVEASSIGPDKIIFAVGANDSKIPQGNELNKIPLEKYLENIKELIEQARKFTNEIYIVSIANVDETALQTRSTFKNSEIEKYNLGLQEIAKNKNAEFIDVYGLLSSTDFCDGLHPNATGYTKLAQVIISKIK